MDNFCKEKISMKHPNTPSNCRRLPSWTTSGNELSTKWRKDELSQKTVEKEHRYDRIELLYSENA